MEFKVAVFAGDGIGPEVMGACLAVLWTLEDRVGGFRLVLEPVAAAGRALCGNRDGVARRVGAHCGIRGCHPVRRHGYAGRETGGRHRDRAKIFDECAARYPDVLADHAYVDATALNMVRRPWDLDVLVMENMFGDILSDLAGGIVGGMGMAPYAEVGDRHGLFQPAHGSAPDIAGKSVANPIATFLSAAMMFEWLGEPSGTQACLEGARLLAASVERGFSGGRIRPPEFGGHDTTSRIAATVTEGIATGLM
jgi:isocitrate/isopropylmalate dehydrogenase